MSAIDQTTLSSARSAERELPALPEPPGWVRLLTDSRTVGIISVGLFLFAWEMANQLGYIDPLFLSAPGPILKRGWKLLKSGTLWKHLLVSGQEFSLGYLIGVVLGIPLGVAAGWYRIIGDALNPFVSALNATPRVVFVPLLIMWFGIGVGSKIAMVALMTFFPIMANTVVAMRTLDPLLVEASRSFGARDRDIFLTIALPASVPYIMTGLRLAVALGFIGVVVGELFASSHGLGHLITVAGANFRSDEVFFGVVLISSIGIGVDALLRRIESTFDRWRTHQAKGT